MKFIGIRASRGLEFDKLVKFIKIINNDIAELNLYNSDCNNLLNKEEEKVKLLENLNLILKSLL